ncbi:hypothetical protein HMPREF0653_01546 [Prevotella disiens JCM 6334 = ATCC 29426]|uniref:Uncharacterized protein n=1 Tax=Prevotella disiens JCM 6334 = ATCC 29426 TaxID=1235811 RepID=A0ABN0NRS5_9BACT|nr:hypothetical protein HMPREF0653_01546 [Prevotella disiens JCM 6334 = ATCC 29426]
MFDFAKKPLTLSPRLTCLTIRPVRFFLKFLKAPQSLQAKKPLQSYYFSF